MLINEIINGEENKNNKNSKIFREYLAYQNS